MITFRPVEDGDLPQIAQWLALDFVQTWWREPADLASVEAKYGPRVGGEADAEVFIIHLDGRAVGMIQRYRLGDHPEWEAALDLTDGAGIDYFLGDPDLAGRSIGSSAISRFVPEVFAAYPEVDLVVAVPQQANVASWRALEKAGFTRHWSGMLDSDDPSDEGPAHVYVVRRPDSGLPARGAARNRG
jgi:aminoglycoside 6'-N-acetyltransferase